MLGIPISLSMSSGGDPSSCICCIRSKISFCWASLFSSNLGSLKRLSILETMTHCFSYVSRRRSGSIRLRFAAIHSGYCRR